MGQRRAITVVLISADAEWRAVTQIIKGQQVQYSPLGEWFDLTEGHFLGEKSNQEESQLTTEVHHSVLFFHGGWGKIAAAASTQYVIDRWQPDLLINLGTCGGIDGRVRRGEILLIEKTIVYDIYEQMGDVEAHIAHYTTNIDLSWLASNFPIQVRRTLLVSGDRDLLVEEAPELVKRYGAIAADWESGAIAFVASRNKARLLILRGVTDLVGPGGGEAYGNLELYETATMQIMEKLIHSLPAWIVLSYIKDG